MNKIKVSLDCVFLNLDLWLNLLIPSRQSTDAKEISSQVDNKLDEIL